MVLPQKVTNLRRTIRAELEHLPPLVNRCVGDLLTHADRLDELIADAATGERSSPWPPRTRGSLGRLSSSATTFACYIPRPPLEM